MSETTATKKYYVEIVAFGGDVIRRIECASRHAAEKVSCGADINLNHDKFYTRIVEGAEALPVGDVQGAGSS